MKQSKALWILVCMLQSVGVVAAELKSTQEPAPTRAAAKESAPKSLPAKESLKKASSANEVAAQEVVATQSVAAAPVAQFHSGRAAAGQDDFSNAGIVASFVDFADSELGDSLGYLLSGELLATLAKTPKEYSVEVVSLATAIRPKYALNKNYHVSATAMAIDYKAPLTFWGAVRKQGNGISLTAFLTMRQELRDSDLLIGVELTGDQRSSFQAGLTRTRYEFAGQSAPVDKLFHRRLVARSKASLLDQPRPNGTDLGIVEAGQALVGLSMHGSWYQVKTADGHEGYIDIDKLKVLPRTVAVEAARLTGRSGPGQQFAPRAIANTHSEFDVLDVTFDERGEGWYQVSADDGSAWIDAEHAHPRFSLSALHFLAGVYYMRAPKGLYTCQFKKAASQFSQFIDASASKEKNFNLASAHQLYAANVLLSEESCGRDREKALVAYTAAVALTPYDATAYNLRAVANLGAPPVAPDVVADLKNALQLDVQDSATRTNIVNLQTAIAQGTFTCPNDLTKECESMYRTVTRENVVRNIARIRQQPHLRLDTKGKRVLPAPDSDVVLALFNRSGSPLSVYVLKESNDPSADSYYHVQLPDGDKAQLRVAAGTYEIAAETPDPSVKSIYGEHTYASPSQYELDFLVRLNDAPIAQQ